MKKLTTDRMRYELSQKDKGKKDSKSSGFVNDAHRKWFGDSKVVDAKGKPLVVYHGTNADISTFDTAKQDPRDAGFWFANEPVYANQYAAGRSGGNVLPVYLSLKNPKVYYDRTVPITTALIKELKAQGYDGIVRDFAGGEEAWRYAPGQREYAVFDPHQIKSAIGNRGTFDPNNPDITKARGGPVYNMDAMRLRLAEGGSTDRMRYELSQKEHGKDPRLLLSSHRPVICGFAEAGVVPGSFAGSKTPDIEKLAKLRDKFIYHSGTSDDLANMKWGLEPRHGDWIKELAKHSGVDPDEILNRSTPLVWMSDNPNWVVMKVARKLKKHLNEVTEDEIRKFGHVALIPKKGDHSEHIWKVGEEGLGDGPYSNVINLNGKKAKAYETDLYSNDMEGNKEPFGVERNEYISARPVEPMFHLVGNDLLHFLKKSGVINKAKGGSVERMRQELSANERKNNLERFLKDSGVQRRMYTGTSKDKDFSKERGLPHLAIGGQGPRNWIKGSVEKVLAPLKSRGPAEADREWLEQHGEQYPEARRMGLEAIPRNEAINQWVDRNLANYVRKQMGATNDPIRKLAEEGIVHYEPQGFVVPAEQEEHANYIRQSNNWQRLAKSNRAKAWEDVTDSSVHQNTVDDLKKSVIRRPEVYKDMVEPWMEKADPSTPLLRPSTSMTAQLLGFDHLVDVLMEDMAQGRIRPDQLSKVSIEHAVRRAHEYDQERKKVMAETALKATEGMPVHKDYGDGFKWIELALPEKGEHLLTELDKRIIADRKDNPVSPEVMDRTLDQRAHKKLADALKYEGDTMGHCVGNYPNRVANGDSRIFSLRDEKNEPHVTVEVNPPKQYDEDDIIERFPGGVTDAMRQGDIGAKKYIANKLAEINNNLPAIKQIKGKQNRAPKDQYLPYVQDFVRSGNWSEINDTRNAGLRRYSDVFNDNEQRAIEATGEPVPDHEWLTGADIQRLHNAITPEGKRLKYDAKGNIVGGDYGSGMKRGGVARSASGNAKYNMDAMRLRLAEGGSTRSGKK